MDIKIKKLDPEAVTPKYATPGSACFDLCATTKEFDIFLPGNDAYVFCTGLAFEIPKDHVMLIFSRSGHGFKDDVRLANCVGVIDSDYRGEVKVKLTRDEAHHNHPVAFKHGDRVAQAMILPVQQVNFDVVDELSETVRGAGGFGSTGS